MRATQADTCWTTSPLRCCPRGPVGPAAAGLSPEAMWDLRLLGCPQRPCGTLGFWAVPRVPVGPTAAGLSPEDLWDPRLLGCPPRTCGTCGCWAVPGGPVGPAAAGLPAHPPPAIMKKLRFVPGPRISRTSRMHEGLSPSPSGSAALSGAIRAGSFFCPLDCGVQHCLHGHVQGPQPPLGTGGLPGGTGPLFVVSVFS